MSDRLCSHLKAWLERNIFPSLFSYWQIFFMWLYFWGPCLLAGCQLKVILCNWKQPSIPNHVAHSQHGSLLLQSHQESPWDQEKSSLLLKCFLIRTVLSRQKSLYLCHTISYNHDSDISSYSEVGTNTQGEGIVQGMNTREQEPWDRLRILPTNLSQQMRIIRFENLKNITIWNVLQWLCEVSQSWQ